MLEKRRREEERREKREERREKVREEREGNAANPNFNIPGVPFGIVVFSSMRHATPKSQILTTPSEESKMFSGFKSR